MRLPREEVQTQKRRRSKAKSCGLTSTCRVGVKEPLAKAEKEQPRLWEVCWEQKESKNRRRGTGEHIDNSFVKFCYKGARRKGVVSVIGSGPRGVCFEDERNNCVLYGDGNSPVKTDAVGERIDWGE